MSVSKPSKHGRYQELNSHKFQVRQSTRGYIQVIESFRFDFEYDYEIRHFWRQLLASSPADVMKS